MLALQLFLCLATTQTAASSLTLPAPLRAAVPADAIDARAAELASRPAAFTAFSLDSFGTPDVRMDVFTSTRQPMNARQALDFVRQFQFGDSGFEANSKLTGTDERPARSVVLVGAEPALEAADATFFDPQADVVVTFRSLRAELSCSSLWTVWQTRTGSTGANYYWYFSGDGVSASCGPTRNTNTDPDASLAFWNGLVWSNVASSASVDSIDSVGGHNTGCYSQSFRFQTYLYNGGTFSARALRFLAD